MTIPTTVPTMITIAINDKIIGSFERFGSGGGGPKPCAGKPPVWYCGYGGGYGVFCPYGSGCAYGSGCP
jgi:hypothetical protein